MQRRGTTRGQFDAVHAGPQEAFETNKEPCGYIRGRISTRSWDASFQTRAIDLRFAQEASIDPASQADWSKLFEGQVNRSGCFFFNFLLYKTHELIHEIIVVIIIIKNYKYAFLLLITTWSKYQRFLDNFKRMENLSDLKSIDLDF